MTRGLWASPVYREAMKLGTLVGREVRRWRFHDRDVIGRQFERAAHSVAANVAEAYGRLSAADKRRFIGYAIGSAREAETWLAKAVELNLIAADAEKGIRNLIVSLIRRLTAYHGSLTRDIRRR